MYKVCAVVFSERSGHAGLTFSLALILYMSRNFLFAYTHFWMQFCELLGKSKTSSKDRCRLIGYNYGEI